MRSPPPYADAPRHVPATVADLSGHGGLYMLNPFAWIDTDVRKLRWPADPVGPENDMHIRILTTMVARTTVVAWGPPSKIPKQLRPRLDEVLRLLLGAGVKMHVLSFTKGGHPEHPLMLRRACRPIPWSPT